MSARKLRIAFVHPDLGIGGAERLVVDAATSLQSKGHEVIIYTSHHDPSHCFAETKDGTLRICVRGDSILPRSLFNSFYIACAILRQVYLTLSLLFYEKEIYDVIFVDQLSACVPLLKLTGAKVLFYCHFPDKLLTKRESILKMMYRWPIDKLEEVTTGISDRILVNSQFTAGIFRESFPSIKQTPEVLYPSIHLESYDKEVNLDDPNIKLLYTQKRLILSINRFERKKNLALAIHAFSHLRDSAAIAPATFSTLRLIIAGGYDPRVSENVHYHDELVALTSFLELTSHTLFPDSTTPPPESTQVVFVCSFNEQQRSFLLSNTICLLYTPENEHFGIVPVEAMYKKIPVIAVDSGGPRESIKTNVTGLLCAPTPEDFTNAMVKLIQEEDTRKRMGENGREHVQSMFSLDVFAERLEEILLNMGERRDWIGEYAFTLALVPVVAWCIYLFTTMASDIQSEKLKYTEIWDW